MIRLFATAAALALMAGAAHAQDGDDATLVEPAIVIAQRPTVVGKLDAPLEDQPQNVTVITRSMLDDFGSPRIQDVAYATVGLQPVALQQGATSYGFFMRGFNGAPIITDGYYSSNNQFGSVGIIDMSVVDSVEVLRGPAALLYGQGNPGGVINLTSKAPTDAFFAAAAGYVGAHGELRAEGDIGGALNETLSGRLIGVIEDSDSFRDFINHKRLLISPRVAAKLGEHTLRFDYTYDDLRYTPDNGPGWVEELIVNLPVERSVQEPGLGQVRSVNQFFKAEGDFRVSDAWKARAGFFWHELRQPDGNLEIDPAGVDPLGPLGSTTLYRDLITSIVPANNGAEDYMFTLQALGKFSTGGFDHVLTVAADYIGNESRYDYAYYSYTPIDYADPVYTPGPVSAPAGAPLFSGEGAFKSRVRAAYLQDLISFGDWRVLLGARVETIETTGYLDPAMTTTAGPGTRKSKTTPRLGVVYDVDDSLTLYASYSEGFAPQYGRSFNNVPFEPEESASYELGVRKRFGDRMYLTASVYDIEKENILVVDPVNPTFNITAGVAGSRGFEAELQGRLNENWRIAAGLAYNDAKITRSADPSIPLGDTLAAAADWSALANVQYRVTEGMLDGMELGANLSYTGERPYVLPNTIELPAYARLDLFVTYPVNEKLEMQLNVNNVFDERIVLANGYGRAQFDTPLSVLLTARYRIGAAED